MLNLHLGRIGPLVQLLRQRNDIFYKSSHSLQLRDGILLNTLNLRPKLHQKLAVFRNKHWCHERGTHRFRREGWVAGRTLVAAAGGIWTVTFAAVATAT